MTHFSELTGIELNDAIAIALGADRAKSVDENYAVTGVPFKFMTHWQKPVFALVSGAGIVERWIPSTDYLIERLLKEGYILMQPPGMPITFIKGDARVEGSTALEAAGRAFVAHFTGATRLDTPDAVH